ncbi:competence/damage-inducible protein A [Odoribacter sp. OttesenSCG-928-J03]|nr:competence/damage-inducible protein A [Odoribacter sp. OttesenSCG-928-J03]MDL2330657.1 competence/damage-inducible protein A [Odoribacter sp. OttesenSCG-928-A06]
MKAILITIGDEILLGQVLDTNSHYISGQLTKIGIEVIEKFTISDKEQDILETVDFAIKHSDLVVVTGGLGPTNDDVTKKVLADYFNSRLILNPEILEWIEGMLKNRNVPMNEKNVGQAMLPDNCRILKNHKGTASGMWFERDNKSVISLPGVPFEMVHLMEDYIVPDLKSRYPELQIDYKVLKVYDIPESELAVRLEDWEAGLPEGLKLAYLPAAGWIRLRLTATGKAIVRLTEYYDSLKKALGELYYVEGEENNIEREFGRIMREKGYTVSTAESCSGGYIAHLITSVPGSSAYFKGSVIAYDNEVKENILGVKRSDMIAYGAVSEQVVIQMAENVKKILKTDCGIATSGVAGPDGGSPEKPVGTVWIAVATPQGTTAQKFVFSSNRERNISKSSVKSLEMLLEEIKEN